MNRTRPSEDTDASESDDRPTTGEIGACSQHTDEYHAGSAVGRRRFVQAAGALLITGVLAGCTDDGDSGGAGDGGSDGDAASVDQWLADTDNYDGVVDRTGTDAVTVEVGPDGNELVFEPAAIRVGPGTTVTWEWVGSGHHNVVAKGESFDSGNPVEGGTFDHTFEESGTTQYYCDPHRSLGMKGAVVVGDSEESVHGQ